MSEKYIIALDQGTSGCRAVAVDANGVVRAQQSVVFSPIRSVSGNSEYKAEELLQAQLRVLNGLLDQIGPANAAGIGVCSQRSTIVLWDKTTGQEVAPVLTWEDGRAQAESDEVPLTQAQVHLQTGLFKTPYFSAPKIAWCLKNSSIAAQAAAAGRLHVSPVASYFIWHLTRGNVFATDPTLAQRTLLWDLHTGNWSDTLCQSFQVPGTCLPQILPTTADYGAYIYKGVKIPICVCVADQQASAAYQGLTDGGTTINYGTGAFVLHHTGTQPVILPGMLSSVAANGPSQGSQFLLEGPVFAAGSVLQWLQQTKGIQFDVAHIDSLCAQAQQPVKLLPALGGLGAPYWDYTVGPYAQNVTPHTTAADWVAGALSGIAGLVADIIYYLRANGQEVKGPLRVSGGLAQSGYLLQAQADLLHVPLELQPQAESTVLGTALLTARQLGWKEPKQACGAVRTFSPRLVEPESQQSYRAWHQWVENSRKCVSKILLQSK